MKEQFFANTEKDINAYRKVFQSLINVGLKHGIPENEITLTNAVQRVEKISRERLKHEEQVKTLGYSTLGHALKALSQYKTNDFGLDISHLPEVFHKPAPIWVLGNNVPKEKGGFLRLSPTKAEKHHRTTLPRIIEAWSLTYTRDAELGEALREQMIEKYQTLAPEKFDTVCYSYINQIDEEEVQQSTEATVPLAEALHFCVGLYPDRLLEDCRDEADQAGEVSATWFKTIDAKFTAALTAEDKEDLARLILTRYIYRLRGGSGSPTPADENDIKRLLSTERWQPNGTEWGVNEHTRLHDLVDTLTYTAK
jgi:hypothetical protein